MADDRAAPARIFLAVGAAIVVMAAIYWFVSYEDAGTTMLVLAAALALWAGGYLWARRGTITEVEGEDEGEAYLPHASIWPIGIGAGAFFGFNGLLLGPWFLFPGAVLLVLSIIGWAAQSRDRS